jgi:transcriptional regulator with XRE-family HTH domain
LADGERENEETEAEAFGRRLLRALRTRGISNVELSRRIKVSSNAVSGWTTGKSAPDYKHLIRIIQALDASPAELLSDAPHPTSPSDQLILRLADLRLTGRVRDLSTVGSGVLTTLEQIDERAAEISASPDDR